VRKTPVLSVIYLTFNEQHQLDHSRPGADRDRTCDIVLAKHALSQLSYSPGPSNVEIYADPLQFSFAPSLSKMGLERLELSTPSLSEKCSNQLSYRPRSPFSKKKIESAFTLKKFWCVAILRQSIGFYSLERR
jgi:hypothetical protein